VSSFGKTWGEAEAFNGYLAVAHGGDVVFAKAYGKADRETGAPADLDTRFRLGSLTKPFTAIAILQLEERGLLRIDDPVRKYLPELPAVVAPVTLHHCLTHTSGVPPLPDDEALVAETGRPHPVAKALASYEGKSLRFAPGERFEYSNAGYTILAAIIERVTGQSYEVYVQQHIFGPAGMPRSTTVSVPSPPGTAVGYALDARDAISVAPPISYVTFGCGAILSTPRDLIAFDRALAGNVLLADASKRRMLAPEKDVGALIPTPSRYALGWFVFRDGDHDVFWHGGGVNGFDADFARVPDANLAVVVLSNVEGSFSMVRKVATGAREIALTGRSLAPAAERAVGTLSAAQLAELVGDYAMDRPSVAALEPKVSKEALDAWAGVSLTADEGRLLMTFSGRSESAEVFRGVDGTLFTKRSGWELVPEASGKDHPGALLLSSVNTSALRARFVRLTSALDPPPAPSSCPAGMVRLPGGAFVLGRTESPVTVDPFCMDLTEVTAGAYATCVRWGPCTPALETIFWPGATDEDRARWNPKCNDAKRSDRKDHPINCVDADQATAFCHAYGKRLPTEAEWEWAARGEEQGRTYPWGFHDPDAQPCWKQDGTCPVGAFPDGDARGGIHDLAGNVYEWTATSVSSGVAVQKGGAWFGRWAAADQASAHLEGSAKYRGPTIGFRCVR
jgi:CubicO group peptidase (beta-lactamase class C family)/formylglycine-generating enzyme required for sulfatase activity